MRKKDILFLAVAILLIIRKASKWIPQFTSICKHWDNAIPFLLLSWIFMLLFLCNIFAKKKWLSILQTIYFSIAVPIDALFQIGMLISLDDDYIGLDLAINLLFAIMSAICISNTKQRECKENSEVCEDAVK